MSYASRSGKARTSASSPAAFAVCDRCGIWWNRNRLNWQHEWFGAALQNTRMLVCPPCMDIPQEQLRAIVLPADPVPVTQPRTEPFLNDETDYRVTAAPSLIDPTTGIPIPQGVPLITTQGDNRTTQPVGRPSGIAQSATQPLFKGVQYGATLSVLSLISDGYYTVTVTCSAPHGMATNSQISVQGASDNRADGTYSVIVTTAMAFSYTTIGTTAQGNLLTGSTAIWTVLVGLPRGYDQLPKT